MQLRQKQVIEAFGRVQAFLADHPLPRPATYGAPEAVLVGVVGRLTALSRTQRAAERQGRAETRRQRWLKRELRERHLRPIARVARAFLQETPGIDVALRIPQGRLPVTKLLADAAAVRETVGRYQPVFVENGCPGDFLERLDLAIAELGASLVERSTRVGERIGAGQAIAAEITRGRHAVQLLDSIVMREFAGDVETLGRWGAARRVHAVGGGGGQPVSPVPAVGLEAGSRAVA